MTSSFNNSRCARPAGAPRRLFLRFLQPRTLFCRRLALHVVASRRAFRAISEEPKGARDLRQLFEAGAAGERAAPNHLGPGSGNASLSLQWLAETVDLSHPPETLDVGFEATETARFKRSRDVASRL